MARESSQLKILTYLIIPPILWAGNSVIGKFATDYIGPFSLSFFRWLIACLLLLIIAAKPLYQARAQLRQHWLALCVLGILGTGMFNTLLYLGLTQTSANNAGIVLTTMPIIIIGLNFMFGFEQTNARQLVALMISFVGVLWVITQGDLPRLLDFNINPGDIIVLISITAWAAYSVLLKVLRPAKLDALPFLAIQFIIGLAFVFPFYLYENIQHNAVIWQTETYYILLYVGIFPSLFAYFFWQQGIAMGGANIAGLISPSISLFTALFAYIFLGEILSSDQLVGAGLIILGILIALINPKNKPASKQKLKG